MKDKILSYVGSDKRLLGKRYKCLKEDEHNYYVESIGSYHSTRVIVPKRLMVIIGAVKDEK